MALSYQIVHTLPGRVRLRFPAMRHNDALAQHLEHMLATAPGVIASRANPAAASVTVDYDDRQFNPEAWLKTADLADDEVFKAELNGKPSLANALRKATFRFEANVPPVAQLVLSAVALAATLIEAPLVITGTLCAISVAPIVNRAAQTILEEKRLGADFLDGTTCVLLIKQQAFLPASVMTFLIAFGEFLRDRMTKVCQDMIGHQLALFEHSVWIVRGNKRERMPVSKLQLGDQIVFYPGELITCEGNVIRGHGTIIPAMPEAEFAPKAVGPGDKIPSNTVLADGKLYVEFTGCHRFEHLDPIRRKQNKRWLQRTQLHRNALRKGYDRVWLTMSAAGLMYAFTRNGTWALSIMCFDFLTGVKIAIPIPVLSSLFKAGKQGILIRNATSLERLAEVDVVVFGRSGALTSMKPYVTDVYVSDGYTTEQVTSYAAALEQRYNHLAAYAISSYANLGTLPVPERHKVRSVTGLGIAGEIEDHFVLVGSTRFLELRDVDITEARPFLDKCKARGDSRACVAIDGKLAGIIAYQDPLRPGAQLLIKDLRKMGINEIALATGASQPAAEAFAKNAGIKTVYARSMPNDKAQIVRRYKRQGRTVAFVGYDVADVPALEEADVAITLGTSLDVARYRADVVITSDSLGCLGQGIRIARGGMRLARENMLVTSAPNWFGLGMSLMSETSPLSSTIMNNGSVILGALNGMRPLIPLPQPALTHLL